jgi:hypothetical protein
VIASRVVVMGAHWCWDGLRSRGLAKGLVLPLLVLAIQGQIPLAGAQSDAQPRFEGAFGLWVTDSAGELGVGWLTASPELGVLEVFSGGRSVHRVETPLGQSHHATLPRPSGDSVLLRFGVLEAEDLHETVIYLGGEEPSAPEVITGVDSLYLVGDVHGEYDRLVALLGNAGLLDVKGQWVGGRRHVAFLGDIFDRGADVTRTLWFLYELERQARTAGGGAHLVLGNHETMIFTHDVRYVSPKEQLIARLHGVSYPELFDIRRSVLGQWMVRRPGLMKVNDVLLAHGGVGPSETPRTVEAVNDSMRTFMSEDLFYRWADTTLALVGDSASAERVADQYDHVVVLDSVSLARRTGLLFDETGILWFRGYVLSDTFRLVLDAVLAEFGAEIHVVAHTPLSTIESRYDGKLLAVDLERPATEMLLLDRDEAGRYRRWKIRLNGPAEPL